MRLWLAINLTLVIVGGGGLVAFAIGDFLGTARVNGQPFAVCFVVGVLSFLVEGLVSVWVVLVFR